MTDGTTRNDPSYGLTLFGYLGTASRVGCAMGWVLSTLHALNEWVVICWRWRKAGVARKRYEFPRTPHYSGSSLRL
jgi:hypothetical protein